MDTPRRLHLESTERVEIEAKGATLGVCIDGKSYFSGEEAFSKAEEVKGCVDALQRVGVAAEDIRLACVTADVRSGILSKSSSARYHLGIIVHSLGQVGTVISVLMQQKNAELEGSYWHFPEFEETKDDLLTRCVTKAKGEALVIAKALGVELLGVYSLHVETKEPARQIFSSRQAAFGGRAKKSPALDMLVFSHTGELSVKTSVEFEMSAFASPEPS